ncbi:hydroxyisourate hydrolase [Vibrio mangrovi]|uniref:5-hydroxyisourate hydrolase n=1 Tax=Vibrio mangrovi TaxID=474394 RepID=A0A1Y6IT22_9VIBR|nr:hydroxyisourate hydrolase [Vibrio mangrovi]MDW6004507.1 hydroxyisourate hydrolase [Vibrio mangrovi]SMS00795.1 5-hydroxyisourate hydrolase precursor [Vibrio mangrovi]
MSTLSCHILDTSSGCPAANILVKLSAYQSSESLASATTDADGRIRFENIRLSANAYTLSFHVAAYCEQTFGQTFFPKIEVHFQVAEQRHYHIPLLLSPYAYSTYRGS